MVQSIYAPLIDLVITASLADTIEGKKLALLPTGADKRDAKSCYTCLHKQFKKQYSLVMPDQRVAYEETPEGWMFWLADKEPTRAQQFFERLQDG